MSDEDDYEFRHLTPAPVRRRDGLLGILGIVTLIGIFLFALCWALSIAVGVAPCLTYSGVWRYGEGVFPICEDVAW